MKFKHYYIAELLSEISMGPFGSNIKKECFVDSGIPVLNGSNLTDVAMNDDAFRYVTKEKADSLGRANAQRGDVVVTHRGTLGQISFIPKDSMYDRYVISQSQFRFRCNEKVIPEYLVYYFHTRKGQHDLLSNASQVGVPALARATTTFQQLEIDLPEIEEQRKIVEILEDIRRKIELNKEINNNLLQQLHILYSRLFCDSAMDTPLGEVVATTSGGTPSRKHDEYYSDSSICWVKSKELLGNYIHETEEHINDLAIKKSSAKLLPKHSVLIAMYGATVGACGVISKPMTCNQAVCALLCNENYPYTYLFQIAYESQQKFINLAVGSAQQNISQVLIKQLNLHSDLNIIQKFHGLALPMHQEIESLQAENMHLAALRDNLLPKLMSGELDVSNIDL